jgi:hypothetical protein
MLHDDDELKGMKRENAKSIKAQEKWKHKLWMIVCSRNQSSEQLHGCNMRQHDNVKFQLF